MIGISAAPLPNISFDLFNEIFVSFKIVFFMFACGFAVLCVIIYIRARLDISVSKRAIGTTTVLRGGTKGDR